MLSKRMIISILYVSIVSPVVGKFTIELTNPVISLTVTGLTISTTLILVMIFGNEDFKVLLSHRDVYLIEISEKMPILKIISAPIIKGPFYWKNYSTLIPVTIFLYSSLLTSIIAFPSIGLESVYFFIGLFFVSMFSYILSNLIISYTLIKKYKDRQSSYIDINLIKDMEDEISHYRIEENNLYSNRIYGKLKIETRQLEDIYIISLKPNKLQSTILSHII
jgi:hypothetical protein